MNFRVFFLFAVSMVVAFALPGTGCREKSPDPVGGTEQVEREEDFIGLSLSEAEKLARKRGLPHRVTMLDGEPRMATRDYLPNRVNFAVEKGRVVGVSRG